MSEQRESENRLVSVSVSALVIIVLILLLGGIPAFLSCGTTRGRFKEIREVKLYLRLHKNHPIDCICNDPVVRKIRKTNKVEEAALFALEELVKGTTKEESAKGYGGCIPAGSLIAEYKDGYMRMVKAYQESGKIDEWGKRFLSQEGEFTPWGDRVRVRGVKIKDGVAYADFSKELYSYGGGSCRVEAIGSSIENTLKQFPGVEKVVIYIEGRPAELQP
jgi:hypothetical protein